MLSCFWKKYLGIECPGCGMQRSMVALLKGELKDSFLLFPALIPILCMFLFLLLHLKYDFKHGARILKINFIFASLLLISAYVFKISYGKL